MPVVKIGTSRQVVIPKKLHDQLGLAAGDYISVELQGNQLVFTPQELIEKRLTEGLEDLKHGRILGPFKTAKAAIRGLHARRK
jgi:AbrB family looped-hinge helix DNA binding protein